MGWGEGERKGEGGKDGGKGKRGGETMEQKSYMFPPNLKYLLSVPLQRFADPLCT